MPTEEDFKAISAAVKYADKFHPDGPLWLPSWMIHLSVPLEDEEKDWQGFVTAPVAKYPIVAREARAILDLIGVLAQQGVKPSEVFDMLVERYELADNIPEGA